MAFSSLASLISAIKDLLRISLQSYRFVHFSYVAVQLIMPAWIGYGKRPYCPSFTGIAQIPAPSLIPAPSRDTRGAFKTAGARRIRPLLCSPASPRRIRPLLSGHAPRGGDLRRRARRRRPLASLHIRPRCSPLTSGLPPFHRGRPLARSTDPPPASAPAAAPASCLAWLPPSRVPGLAPDAFVFLGAHVEGSARRPPRTGRSTSARARERRSVGQRTGMGHRCLWT